MYLPDLPKMPDQSYERQIRQICAVPAIGEVESVPEPPVDLTVFICFTNRSGSNYLASLLATTGELPTAREIFNVKAVSNVCQKHAIKSLDDYCRRQMRQHARNRRFAAKVGLAQLLALAQLGYLGTVFPNPRFIHIQRYDVIAQSISFMIATQNQAFTAKHQPAVKDEDLHYDGDRIARTMNNIATRNRGFQDFLLRNRLPTLPLLYEQLSDDPFASLTRIMAWLGLAMPENLASRDTTQPQPSTVKDAWRDRFIAESGNGVQSP
jgi:trehalose 2-sulfotransferase